MMLEGLTGITKSSYTGDDLISRQNIKYHTQLEAMGNGQYEEVEVAYKNDIESLPSADEQDNNRLYIRIYVDDEPSRKAEKLYQICGETESQEVAQWLKEYFLSADKPTRWISVRERLPEKNGCYLVSTTGENNYIVDIAFYIEGMWHKTSRIKAWMPLPEPYREEREEYKLATEQMEHDTMYEPTYNSEDGSM